MAAPTAVNTHPTRGEKPGFPFSARMLASMISKVHIIKAGLCDNEPAFSQSFQYKNRFDFSFLWPANPVVAKPEKAPLAFEEIS